MNRNTSAVKWMMYLLLVIACMILACEEPSRDSLNLSMSLSEEEWKVFREELFPRFEERTGIQINAYQIESGQMATKLEALIKAGKSEIDLFAQDNMNLADLVAKNLVLDLSDREESIPAAVMPNLVEMAKFGESLFFMPFRPNVQIVYYNHRKFDHYGLAVPRTWEQLLQVGKVFAEEEGMGRIVFKGYGGDPTATQIYEIVLQAGGDPYAFNDDGCVRAFRFLQNLKPYLSPESQRAKWDTVNDILARREGYLAANWPFGVVVLVKDYGLDFIRTYSGWAGPAGEHHVIGGDVLGIPRNAGNTAAAFKFIAFLQEKATQETLVARLGWPSIRKDAYTQVADWHKPHFEAVKSALAKGVFRRNVTWWPTYKKFAARAYQHIVMQDEPVKATLDRFKQQLEKERSRGGH